MVRKKEGVSEVRQIDSINEIHQLLEKCLAYFAAFCKDNNLRYYLSNGTLLGAVKYHGFIPWDDDVDVMMPRRDYNRLMKSHNIDNGIYRLLSRERNDNWKMPYAKLSVESTLLQETSADFGVPCGISVDIFPIDNWSGSYPAALLQASYLSFLRRCFSASIEQTFFTPRTGLKRMLLWVIWAASHMVGTGFFFDRINRQIIIGYRHKNRNYVGCVAWAAYGRGEVLPHRIFKRTITVTFEGIEYPAPVGYDIYLRRHYGNYRSDLPLSRQKSNHTIKVWDKADG